MDSSVEIDSIHRRPVESEQNIGRRCEKRRVSIMLRGASQELLRLLTALDVEGRPQSSVQFGRFSFGKKWSPRVPGLIQEVAGLREPIALLNLIHWIHHEDETIRDAAEEAVETLWPLLKPTRLLELEVRLRESWASYRFYSPGNTTFCATRPASWMLASLDSNGFHREEATRRLDASNHLQALHCLLLRLNDWVPQVRTSAEQFISRRTTVFSTEQLISTLPILAALDERKTARDSVVLRNFVQLLRTVGRRRRLLEALPTLPARARRFTFGILGETGALDDPESGRFLLESGDPFLGLMFLVILRRLGKLPSADWLESALHSKWPGLRKVSLQTWAEASYPGFKERAMHALMDHAAGVRDVANFWVRKLDPGFDLQAHYSDIIGRTASSKMLAAAISGFHESGGKWPVDEYSRWLQHHSVAVRRATLRAYVGAYPDESEAALEHSLLGSEDPALEKLTFLVLARRSGTLSISTLHKVIESSSRRTSRIRALALIVTKDKWQSAEHLLYFVRSKDAAISAAAVRWLKTWIDRFNRSFTQPSRAQLENLRHELSLSKALLPESLGLFMEELFTTAIPSN